MTAFIFIFNMSQRPRIHKAESSKNQHLGFPSYKFHQLGSFFVTSPYSSLSFIRFILFMRLSFLKYDPRSVFQPSVKRPVYCSSVSGCDAHLWFLMSAAHFMHILGSSRWRIKQLSPCHLGGTEFPTPNLNPDPVLTVGTIWGMSRQMEILFPSVCAF